MDIILVLLVGGIVFWLLYGRGGNPPKPLTAADIAAAVCVVLFWNDDSSWKG